MLYDIHKHNVSYFEQNHSKKCSESNLAIQQSRQPCPAPMCGGRGAAIRGAGGASEGPAHGEAPPVQAAPSPAPNVGKCEHTNQLYSCRFVRPHSKNWPQLGSLFSGDSVSVITSVLNIENIDPSWSQNFGVKTKGLSWGRYFR